MSARRRLAFWLVVALQALVPLGMIGWNELALATGREVTLRTVPVDPVDLFRGRYVVLRYEISRVPVGPEVQRGDTVYVPLVELGEAWAGGLASRERPSGDTFIRGAVRDVAGGAADVEYGIETYFADEEEARRLEGAGQLLVRVVLDENGRGRVSRVEPVR